MKSKLKVLFQKDDSKFRAWQHSLKRLGASSQAVKGSAINSPYVLFKYIVSANKPEVFVFRYLNDYDSAFKSYIRLISEILTVLLCKLFGIRIWWICHNIDKETQSHHHALSRFRRNLIKMVSEYIFATHHLLVPHAVKILGVSNVKSISLGYLEENVYDTLTKEDEVNIALKKWLDERRNQQSKFIFVVGTSAHKVLHFKYVNALVNQLNQEDNLNTWYALVVGEKVESNEHIYNIGSKYLVPSIIIEEYMDYYYRVIDDLSVSYTVYEAAWNKKPILTEMTGFLPEMVSEFNLGYVIDRKKIKEFIEELKMDQVFGFNLFLKNNNWDRSASTFIKCLDEKNK